ncbi:MAG: hypothetical protein ACPG77_12250 [Nannocystaceae bacterium]
MRGCWHDSDDAGKSCEVNEDCQEMRCEVCEGKGVCIPIDTNDACDPPTSTGTDADTTDADTRETGTT